MWDLLVVECGIFVVACGIFVVAGRIVVAEHGIFSCHTQDLCYGLWNI